MTDPTSNKALLTGAAVNTVINAVINGAITWFKMKDHGPLPLTQNAIAGGPASVLSDAVPGALALAVVFTAIGYFTLKLQSKPPFFPKVLLLTIKHVFMVLGILVTAGVLFQNAVGTVEVSPLTGTVVVGLIAGVTAGAIDYSTKARLIAEHRS